MLGLNIINVSKRGPRWMFNPWKYSFSVGVHYFYSLQLLSHNWKHCILQSNNIRTHYDRPSQMHENLLISRVQTRAIASVLTPLINKLWDWDIQYSSTIFCCDFVDFLSGNLTRWRRRRRLMHSNTIQSIMSNFCSIHLTRWIWSFETQYL